MMPKLAHINKHLALMLLFLVAVPITAFSQNIPERPYPPRLVNDFTGLLSEDQIRYLEDKLVHFNDTTSTQIAIVIVNSLGGNDKAAYAYEIGETWGVGQKGFNNGIVVLLKPKTTSESGDVFIATGYGLEGAIPDALAERIVNNEMIPAFRQNDYFTGLDNAVNILMSLASGEYTAEQYEKQIETSPWAFLIPLIIFIIVFAIFSGKR
ncbi:MAG: TPM domain-containing protein, partial [Bacteroidales bacterium]|nr:TPM domain-containing protein [Bacteroidales bacterium]